jgi:hypothetical protein
MADRFEFVGEVVEVCQEGGYAISALYPADFDYDDDSIEESIIKMFGAENAIGNKSPLGKLRIIVERIDG